MGANAQTTVPTFTASQVLTADQMNQSARTGVPVFADSTARDAAFGGTGEKVLAEGQLAYLEDSNIVQYYDGSSWATVGPGTPGGLVYVAGASVSAVTSFSLPNSTFTATYRNYRVIVEGLASASGQAVLLRMRASGTDDSSANYYGSVVGVDFGGTARNVATNAGTSQTLYNSYTVSNTLMFDVCAPQASVITKWGGNVTGHNTTYGGGVSGAFNGLFNATTSFDSLSLIFAVGYTFTGTYRVYGYADS